MGCPYMEEYGVGDYYCKVDDKSVDYDTFNECCYHSLDYHKCAAWNHLDYFERHVKGTAGAKRAYGDW